MIHEKERLIVRELQEGIGAIFDIEPDRTGLRSAMRVWFADLGKNGGPIASLKPHGLRGHKVNLRFGSFAGGVIEQMKQAKDEDIQLARALVDTIDHNVALVIAGQDRSDWTVKDGTFLVEAILRDLDDATSDTAVIKTCGEVIAPLMAAMAELIGYDVIEDIAEADVEADEGAIKQSVVARRERNPRSRLLSIRIHGSRCKVCEDDPVDTYGSAGDIIEVHHLEPLSLLTHPRAYDPKLDLVPLCPNCHRAAHTRRPIPWSIEELRQFMGRQDD